MTSIFFKDGRQRKRVIEILFEDDNFIVVNKPPHLPVIPDRFGAFNYNLRDLLTGNYHKENPDGKIWVVHRIDADTSGLVLFAKNEEYHRLMSDIFEKREIEKYYLAITDKILPDFEGTIDRPLLKTSRRTIVHQKGKPSQTEYRVVERFDGKDLVELKLLTGRTHQIRVHLKSIGCALFADAVYGNREVISLANIKSTYHSRDIEEPRALCSRLTLHAHRLQFADPKTGDERKFEALLPKDLMAVLKALRKYRSVKEFLKA